MKKEILKIMSVIIFFIFAFTSLSSGSGIDDERLRNTNNTDRPELNSTDTVATVTVSSDVSLANGAQPSSNTESPGAGAQAVASGYIQSGKSKNEVVSGLTQLGYTQTEAEIAYSKASANISTETTDPANVPTATTEPENTGTETNQPAISATDRVAQGVGTRPVVKFRNNKAPQEKEVNTVKEMQSEGYSITDIAQGFMDNGYTSDKVIGIFKEEGVSADDTFNALSTIVVDKALEQNAQQKPSAKFKTNSKLSEQWEKQQQEKENGIKQTEIKGLVEQMSAAGYDIKPALGGIVQSLKDAGMSAAEVKNYLIGKVSDIKPKAKFRNHGLFGFIRFAFNKKPTMESYGEGEIALATAMLQAGYSKEDVQSAFENKNSRFYGAYSYTSGAITGIMSAAENRINGTNQPQQTTTGTNTQLESDILKRATTPLPI